MGEILSFRTAFHGMAPSLALREVDDINSTWMTTSHLAAMTGHTVAETRRRLKFKERYGVVQSRRRGRNLEWRYIGKRPDR